MPKPYIPNDRWSQRATKEGYRARSVYKLMELDEQYHLLSPGMRVLDVGAAPGSWLQYTAQVVGPGGKILGIDLKPITPIAPYVITKVCDIFDDEALKREFASLGPGKFDLILSDIAPNTSGIKDVDQWRSLELSRRVVEIAVKHLRSGGTVVMKVFRGRDFDAFTQELKSQFRVMKVRSVGASRDRSREVYVVCR
jgi:23S rRNA (uridine2552-2'-O)-methyltransferase